MNVILRSGIILQRKSAQLPICGYWKDSGKSWEHHFVSSDSLPKFITFKCTNRINTYLRCYLENIRPSVLFSFICKFIFFLKSQMLRAWSANNICNNFARSFLLLLDLYLKFWCPWQSLIFIYVIWNFEEFKNLCIWRITRSNNLTYLIK